MHHFDSIDSFMHELIANWVSLLISLSHTQHTGNKGFDVLLGAEITYLSASIDPLLDTVLALLLSCPRYPCVM
jgi:hypothetical protein